LPTATRALFANNKERMCHVTSQLTDAYQTHIERQEDLRFQLVAVISALNTERVTPLLLKGAVHLTLDSAEWHQARAMRDLDILVHSSEAQEPLGCCHLWAISRITIPRLSIATCRKCAFQGAAAPSRSISRRSHLTLVPLSRRRRCGGWPKRATIVVPTSSRYHRNGTCCMGCFTTNSLIAATQDVYSP